MPWPEVNNARRDISHHFLLPMPPFKLPKDIFHKYAYTPPDEQHRELFRKVSEFIRASAHGAGWLPPDDPAECDGVFAANSIQSAIQLLREILPKSTLSNASWNALVRATCSPTQDPKDTDEPPSAQIPNDSPTPSTGQTPTPKRGTKRATKRSRTAELDEAEVPANITVTNNNRRSDQRRKQKRKRSIGLVNPREEDPPAEHGAYASITPEDEISIAWIIKQPISNSTFYDTADTPYATASRMLQNALALGNEAARSHAASFLKSWRSLGTPLPTRVAPPSTPTGTQTGLIRRTFSWQSSPQPNVPNYTFRDAWDSVNLFEGQLTAVHIWYRWAMAILGRIYAEKITELEKEDEVAGRGQGRSRDGKGNLRTEAKKSLLPLVFPNAAAKATDENYITLSKRLSRATRWYEAADKLGWGSLCLMPHDMISNTWVERTLHVGEWHIWLDLVKRVNPDAYDASQAFDSWLGSESIAGGSIAGKEMLRIEEAPLIDEIEEVRDSEDEGDFGPTQSEVILSSGPARQLRQLTLPELFGPHR
jgi:hypothetical protein